MEKSAPIYDVILCGHLFHEPTLRSCGFSKRFNASRIEAVCRRVCCLPPATRTACDGSPPSGTDRVADVSRVRVKSSRAIPLAPRVHFGRLPREEGTAELQAVSVVIRSRVASPKCIAVSLSLSLFLYDFCDACLNYQFGDADVSGACKSVTVDRRCSGGYV